MHAHVAKRFNVFGVEVCILRRNFRDVTKTGPASVYIVVACGTNKYYMRVPDVS